MPLGEPLRRSAARHPEKAAILFRDDSLTYAELDAAANRFAHLLIGLGIGLRERVALLAGNRPDCAIAYFGAARAGAAYAPLSPRYTEAELAFVLARAAPALLLVETALAAKAEAALAKAGVACPVLVLDRPADFAAALARHPAAPPDVAVADDDPVSITFTGGTTGFPKGVVGSHAARLVNATTVAVEFGLDERDVAVVATPLYHAAGLVTWFVPTLMLGLTDVVLPSWDAAAFLDAVERHRATAAFLVPTQIAALLDHRGFSAERLRSLRLINHAGAPMPAALTERARAALPHVEFVEHYGQSEAGPIAIRRGWHEAKRGTVGRRAFNVDVEVLGADGLPAPAGTIGEVATRGQHLFTAYLGDPEATRAAFTETGWLRTGDIGRFDEDGFLTLVDRAKDMIVAGGENIYPSEIETVLLRHPAVAECAVFGIPDERWGELPAAHVVLASGRSATEQELVAFCLEHLARHKRPRLVKLVDALPRTAVGKLQKNLIRAAYWEGRERKI
jgi:fatty-acyl-CoA synthase